MEVIKRYDIHSFEDNKLYDKDSDKYLKYLDIIEEIKKQFWCFKSNSDELTNHQGHTNVTNFNKYNNNIRKDSYNKKNNNNFIKKYVKPLSLQNLHNNSNDNSLQIIRSQLNKLSQENFQKICFYINFKMNNVEDLAILIFKFCESSNVYTNLYSAILIYSINFINNTKKRQLIKTIHNRFEQIFYFNSKTTDKHTSRCNDEYDEFCLEVKFKQQHINNIHFLFFLSQCDALQLKCFYEQILCHYLSQISENYNSQQIDWKNIEIAIDSCYAWCKINAQSKTIPVYHNESFEDIPSRNLIDKSDLNHCIEILKAFDFSKNMKLKFKLLDLKEIITNNISKIN